MKRLFMLASAILVAGGVAAAGGVALGSVAAGRVVARSVVPAAKHGPRIVAKPASVMVNRTTTLTGTGFKRHKRLTILECSAPSWIVPQQICNHRNAVKVRTNARGGFTVKIKALVCPAAKPPIRSVGPIRPATPAGFSRHCYLGVPRMFGVDQEALRPSARITVTGP